MTDKLVKADSISWDKQSHYVTTMGNNYMY